VEIGDGSDRAIDYRAVIATASVKVMIEILQTWLAGIKKER